jgi:hypothetical protein
MVPLYAALLGDLGPGDFVKVDCAACGHTALLVREADRLALRAKLAPAFLSRLGLSPRGQGSQPTGPGAVPRVWCARPGSRVDQVGEVSRLILAGIGGNRTSRFRSTWGRFREDHHAESDGWQRFWSALSC